MTATIPPRRALDRGNAVRGKRGAKGRPIDLQLVEGGGDPAPLYLRLYRKLRGHILEGALVPGSVLPSARLLASELSISRNTVEAAYAQLQSEGFIERRVGSGTVVAQHAAEAAPFRRRPATRPALAAPSTTSAPLPIRLSKRGQQLAEDGRHEQAFDRQVGHCAPDVQSFPLNLWVRLLVRHSRRLTPRALRSSTPQGLLSLRKAIADQVRLTRGVQCEPEQVIIVNSTQQAIDLAARVLLDPGETALIEEPGYSSARSALRAAGARVVGIPVDSEGIVADHLASESAARLLYVTPSHQFPLGVTMTLARRLQVLRWAAASEAWVLEDDYDSEFRYDGRPIAALQGLDTAGRVLYLGTWNKVLFPGLRLAYLVAPPGLVDAFVAARRLTDGASPVLVQQVLAEFLTGGYLSAHLRQSRRTYTERRDALVAAIRKHWGPQRAVPGPDNTGLHLVVRLPDGVDDTAVAASLPTDHPVGVGPLSRYYDGPRRMHGLLISYGSATPEQIDDAVRHLAPRIMAMPPAARYGR